jgi:hypothetical protein
MELIYRPSESTVRPVEIEKSKHTVFLRRNIVEEERTYAPGETQTMWVYEEAKLSHEEFDKYASFIALKNAINGTNDSTNIINIMNNQAIGANDQLIIMEALADLYEAIASKM